MVFYDTMNLGQGRLHGALEKLLVEHYQGRGQAINHRIDGAYWAHRRRQSMRDGMLNLSGRPYIWPNSVHCIPINTSGICYRNGSD